ncbi:MAG: PqqD family protein [Ruminococcaceae bacterium]|nr:PqqD family protein [Oscillospiraceae bacterium]
MNFVKIKKGYILRQVNDKFLVAAIGKESKKFAGYILLNDTGVFLWKKLEKGIDESKLCNFFMEEYGIDRNTAQKDIEEFLKPLKGANIIE